MVKAECTNLFFMYFRPNLIMFFLLSKILFFFICPLSWIIILLIIGTVIKSHKVKQRIILISLVGLYLFSNPFLLNQFAKQWDIVSSPNLSNDYSAAIVLGGFVSKDSKEIGYFNSASDRFIQAVKLKTQNKISHILISGGTASLKPTTFTEASWVSRELKQFNVPDDCILIENKSRNTFENASNSKIILKRTRLHPPYVLITSAFHMRRSLMIFKAMGVDIVPFSCDYIAGKQKTTLVDFVPDATTLFKWNYYIKEVIGYGVYYLRL